MQYSAQTPRALNSSESRQVPASSWTWIGQARRELGCTPGQLAAQLGCDVEVLVGVELGILIPSPALARALRRVLG